MTRALLAILRTAYVTPASTAAAAAADAATAAASTAAAAASVSAGGAAAAAGAGAGPSASSVAAAAALGHGASPAGVELAAFVRTSAPYIARALTSALTPLTLTPQSSDASSSSRTASAGAGVLERAFSASLSSSASAAAALAPLLPLPSLPPAAAAAADAATAAALRAAAAAAGALKGSLAAGAEAQAMSRAQRRAGRDAHRHADEGSGSRLGLFGRLAAAVTGSSAAAKRDELRDNEDDSDRSDYEFDVDAGSGATSAVYNTSAATDNAGGSGATSSSSSSSNGSSVRTSYDANSKSKSKYPLKGKYLKYRRAPVPDNSVNKSAPSTQSVVAFDGSSADPRVSLGLSPSSLALERLLSAPLVSPADYRHRHAVVASLEAAIAAVAGALDAMRKERISVSHIAALSASTGSGSRSHNGGVSGGGGAASASAGAGAAGVAGGGGHNRRRQQLLVKFDPSSPMGATTARTGAGSRVEGKDDRGGHGDDVMSVSLDDVLSGKVTSPDNKAKPQSPSSNASANTSQGKSNGGDKGAAPTEADAVAVTAAMMAAGLLHSQPQVKTGTLSSSGSGGSAVDGLSVGLSTPALGRVASVEWELVPGLDHHLAGTKTSILHAQPPRRGSLASSKGVLSEGNEAIERARARQWAQAERGPTGGSYNGDDNDALYISDDGDDGSGSGSGSGSAGADLYRARMLAQVTVSKSIVDYDLQSALEAERTMSTINDMLGLFNTKLAEQGDMVTNICANTVEVRTISHDRFMPIESINTIDLLIFKQHCIDLLLHALQHRHLLTHYNLYIFLSLIFADDFEPQCEQIPPRAGPEPWQQLVTLPGHHLRCIHTHHYPPRLVKQLNPDCWDKHNKLMLDSSSLLLPSFNT